MNRLLPALPPACLAVLLCLPLAGCGQKGALYLPPPAPPQSAPSAPASAPTPTP